MPFRILFIVSNKERCQNSLKNDYVAHPIIKRGEKDSNTLQNSRALNEWIVLNQFYRWKRKFSCTYGSNDHALGQQNELQVSVKKLRNVYVENELFIQIQFTQIFNDKPKFGKLRQNLVRRLIKWKSQSAFPQRGLSSKSL